ncbi:MAG TPA: hypothetical protein VGD64_14815 [Acidisarcina sp.]
MKFAQKFGLAGPLMLALIGCRHAKTTQLAPAQPPSINVKPVGAPPSGNPLTTQSQPPLPSLPPATEDASKHAPKPPPKVHRRRKIKPSVAPATSAEVTTAATNPVPATPAPAQPQVPAAAAPVQTAEATGPGAPASPSIGLLSTGDVSTGAQTRQSTMDLIANTESGLKSIKRMLESATDQQTASQIRAFLQKARTALELNDLDGAHTLATKAKVLLDELTKP